VKANPLRGLQELGQSVWLDFISRSFLTSGSLQRLIDSEGVTGVTSNPKTLSDAITEGRDYDEDVAALARADHDARSIYEKLAIEDVKMAADQLRPVYECARGTDGFVSLEVSPDVAYDPAQTIAEARRLWAALDRPNVMIKIPATREGLFAIQQAITEGININITLIFGLQRYREVVEAYLAGLEARVAAGQPVSQIVSVASFFLSRIDVLVDGRLNRLREKDSSIAPLVDRLKGQVAVAHAKIAYQIYKDTFRGGDRFKALANKGANPQRLLWASTSTKNPAYPDLMYIEPLIGPDTINTMPLTTLHAYRDHGDPAPRLEDGIEDARNILQRLPEAGLDVHTISEQLEREGVRKFAEPFASLLGALDRKLVSH
jgi:transaldolase